MHSSRISPSCALLLFLASFSYAQDQPAEEGHVSPTSPPFPLDSNGEAHFNIPVVVKLADLNAAAAAAAAGAHRRDIDANTAEDAESPQPVPAFDDSAAKIRLAPPAHVEPAFEVAHQGSEDDTSADLEARDMPAYNPGTATGGAGTHTVLLVETTGTVVSTVTGPCSDSSQPTPPAADSVDATTTTTTTATTTIIHTAGLKPPVPLNHTGYPLRNGTNSTIPVNGTGKPHAMGLGGAKPSGTGAYPINPVNGVKPSVKLTGDAVAVQVGGLMVLGVGALVAAAVL